MKTTVADGGRKLFLFVSLVALCRFPVTVCGQRRDTPSNAAVSPDVAPEAREKRASTLDSEYNFPWVTHVRSLGALRCSGVLIDTAWVLASATCFDRNYHKDTYNVDLLSPKGDNNTNDTTTSTTGTTTTNLNNPQDLSVLIESFYLHGGFRIGQTRHDLALISLSQNVTSPYQPADVIGAEDDVSLDECLSLGWDVYGNSQTSTAPSVRKWRTVNNTECSQTYSITVPSDQLCALRPADGQGDCQGHKGSPLVCKVNGTWKVTGLVSRDITDLCTSGSQGRQPSLFLSVQYYLSFVEKRGHFGGIPTINGRHE